MSNLNFRYAHENPYNSVMENILNHFNFIEEEDDDESIEYYKIVESSSDIDDIMENYTDVDTVHILQYAFRPASTYGWGFNREILVTAIGIGNEELDEFYIPINKFIDIFTI